MTTTPDNVADVTVLSAWVLILDRVPFVDMRYLAVVALNDFRGARCIDCIACNGIDNPMTVTAAVAHRRKTGTHRLTLNDRELREPAPCSS